MKKFFIVYKDGSQQTLMPAMHNTRKKAEETLMDYIHHHNKRSDCCLSVFDFAIEEEDSEVLSFEEAKQIVGSANFVFASESLRFSDIELNMGHIGALIALNELFTIAQAWNKEDNFVPDFANHKQAKWYPFFEYRKGGIRFDSAFVAYATGSVSACFGFRLCFKTRERAEQFGRQFVDLYNQVFLL